MVSLSEMKNKKRAIPPLPKGASDKEIIRWAKTHGAFGRLDAGVSELVDDHSDLNRRLGVGLGVGHNTRFC